MLLQTGGLALGLIFFAAMVRVQAAPAGNAAARASASRVPVDADDIGGVVTSSKGPEAGVWVIAETADLGTKFRKIVVTNDEGQYLLPQLPKANYKVWVRGYGLVDSPPVEATPGETLALTAVIAPSPQAAAQFYPADYWFSLVTSIPPKSAFPMTLPPSPPLPGPPDPVKLTHGGGGPPKPVTTTPIVIATQGEYLQALKGCDSGCHQVGLKATREIPASLAAYGPFNSNVDAWARMMSSGQLGRAMLSFLDRLNRDRGLAMYADWAERIAKGEVPPAPPRPQGTERNVVVTVWDWAVRAAFLHALISTDKRNPSVNGYGPVYGAEWSAGALAVVDPVNNTKVMIPVPLPNESERVKQVTWTPQRQLAPSLIFGDELVWDDPINPGPITMDGKGRVWFNVENQLENPAFCRAGSDNIYAKYSPRDGGGKGVDIYDPKTGKFDFVYLCFEAERVVFADDKDNTVYFSVANVPGGIGWVNTRVWDQTHDSEKSQGWCPAVMDYNRDGKLGAYTMSPEPIDPDLDRMVDRPGAYGVAYNPVDGSVWYSNLQTLPGRMIRMTKGANPPSTCTTEVYEVPYDPQGEGPGGNVPRGIDIDTDGVLWTPLSAEGILASFDRRKCKTVPTSKEAITGRVCREGWSFYPVPGPIFKADANGNSDPTIKVDENYYMWVDRFNAAGLGKNVPILDGTTSDSLVAFQPETKTWVRLTEPYPMGFFSRFFDARIDDPKAGWKGRGIYAANQSRGTQMTEGYGGKSPSQLFHFQVRPDPLAH
jgi:hypothetical protein